MNSNESTHVVVDLPILNARQKSDPFGRPYVRHFLDVDARQIPDIPDDANARDAESFKNAKVYKEVAESAMAGVIESDDDVTPGLFGYKNLGAIILADRLDKVNDHVARLYIRKPDEEKEDPGGGAVNGGHSLQILRNLKKKYGSDGMPENFIEVKVCVGIPASATAEVSGGTNSVLQVKDTSLIDLKGLYEPLKADVQGTRLEGNVAWREDDDGDVRAEDIISLMTVFRRDLYPVGDSAQAPPIVAYSMKKKTLEQFKKDPDGYYKLRPVLRDILELTDYVRTTGREAVNTAGGSFKNYKHIDKAKEGKFFEMPFTGKKTDWRVNMAAAMPILAAFRRFLEVDPNSEKGEYRWINGNFNRVKAIWDTIAVDAHRATNASMVSLGRSLTNLGKSRAHWDGIDRIVEVAELREKVAAATS